MQELHHQLERRSGIDRRNGQTAPHSLSSLFGRRKHVRRKEDRKRHFYVDRYGAHFILAFLLSLIFCIADAFLTLEIIHLGGSELNPVMDYFIKMGPMQFLAAKYVLTASSLVFILVHKNYPLFSGRITGKVIVMSVPILYAILLIYELFLIH